jgi:hypothetical protein
MTVAQKIAIRRSIAARNEMIAAEAAAEKKHQARIARRGFFARRAKAAQAA